MNTTLAPSAPVREFKDLGIKSEIKSFTGPKINVNKLLNKKVTFLDYKIEPSKFPEKGNGNRLTVQIIYEKEHRIFFSSSVVLQDIFQKTKKEDFPFSATLVLENDRLELK